MIQTLSTLFDSHHIFHPLERKEKFDHDQPTLFRRIAGIVLVALSIPFTLGIATGFFAYWAHRKVVHVEEQNQSELDQRVESVFGKSVKPKEPVEGSDGVEEKPEALSPEKAAFVKAVNAVQKGDLKALKEALQLDEFPKDSQRVVDELFLLVVEHDRPEMVADVYGLPTEEFIPLHKAKSPEMVNAIVQEIEENKREEFVNWANYESKGNTALHYQQNLEVVKALIDAGAKLEKNDSGQTPLHLCTDPKIAELLIDQFGTDSLEAKDDEGRTPLFTVPATVKRLLIRKGADLKATDDNDKTILHYFSEDSFKEDPKLIHTILRKVNKTERKDFVNTTDNRGDVALEENLPLSVVKALVKAGADFPEAGKKSPLHSCEDPEVAKYLIQKFGKKILMQKNADGHIPLIINKHVDVLRVMIEKIEDITVALDDKGHTILHYFDAGALKENPELVDAVFARIDDSEDQIAFVNKANNIGYPPLMYEVPLEVVKALVEAGADYPALGLHGVSNPEVAEYLIDNFGKDILLQKNAHGKIPLLANENPEVLKVIIQKMEDITLDLDARGNNVLHYFSVEPLKNHPELITDILEKIEDEDERTAFVNKQNADGFSPLMYTVPLDVVKALLDAGAEYYVEGKRTHLHICYDPKTAQFLIDQYGTGEDHLEKADENGRSPLMRNQNPAVVQLLIAAGAKVDARNEHSGRQPLFYAKSVEVAQKLIAAGAKVDAKPRKGQTALFGFISPTVAHWLITEKGMNPQDKDEDGHEPIHLLPNEDFNVELAKVLYGQRGKDFDWNGNVPPIMENAKFQAWLATL